MENLVHPGDSIEVEYDQEPRDQYRRLPAFVWLRNGMLLNEAIICEGYGNAYTRFPFKQEYMDRFRACERQAREQGKGLWGSGLVPQSPTATTTSQTAHPQTGEIRGNKRSRIYHLPNCPNYHDISPANGVAFKSEDEARHAGYRKARNCP
ncbi:MAG: thermonuclease family protein [Deltaproteobacteria bacterium]|nr:thermonuclease family protein [Deltaproteobacteria bacterium]